MGFLQRFRNWANGLKGKSRKEKWLEQVRPDTTAKLGPLAPISPARLAPVSPQEPASLPPHEDFPIVPQGLSDEVGAFILDGAWYSGFRSSNVKAMQWSAATGVLYVEYLNGGIYDYQPVDQDEALDFATSPSKGTWVWEHLRVRGTVFGYQKEYSFLSALSSWSPRWMDTAKKTELHGTVGSHGSAPGMTQKQTEAALLAQNNATRKTPFEKAMDAKYGQGRI
jgi:hypothetical protein